MLYVSSGAPYQGRAYAVSDLGVRHSYPTDAYPKAIAVSPNGASVAVGRTGVAAEIHIFRADGSSKIASTTYPPRGNPDVLARGLAFTADGKRVLAVVKENFDKQVVLHVFNPYALTPPAMRLKVSKPLIDMGQSVVVTATLGAWAAGRTFKLYGVAAGGEKALVATVRAAAGGKLSVKVRPKAGTTYTAEFAGDAVYKAAQSAAVAVKVRGVLRIRVTGSRGTKGGAWLFRYSKWCWSKHVLCPSFSVTLSPAVDRPDREVHDAAAPRQALAHPQRSTLHDRRRGPDGRHLAVRRHVVDRPQAPRARHVGRLDGAGPGNGPNGDLQDRPLTEPGLSLRCRAPAMSDSARGGDNDTRSLFCHGYVTFSAWSAWVRARSRRLSFRCQARIRQRRSPVADWCLARIRQAAGGLRCAGGLGDVRRPFTRRCLAPDRDRGTVSPGSGRVLTLAARVWTQVSRAARSRYANLCTCISSMVSVSSTPGSARSRETMPQSMSLSAQMTWRYTSARPSRLDT